MRVRDNDNGADDTNDDYDHDAASDDEYTEPLAQRHDRLGGVGKAEPLTQRRDRVILILVTAPVLIFGPSAHN